VDLIGTAEVTKRTEHMGPYSRDSVRHDSDRQKGG
jgi:hypothetical protein